MALENGKWRVVKGDCLWNIAKTTYKNPYKWVDIANANGISQKNPIIYPNQLLILPGITSGTSSGGSSTPAPAINTKQPKIDFFVLRSGYDRDMVAGYSYSRENFDHFEIKWQYALKETGTIWNMAQETTTKEVTAFSSGIPADATKVKFSVKPISKTYTTNNKEVHYWTDGEWAYQEYNYANNPPSLPPDPNVNINSNNVLTVTIENIDENINADSIEIVIYQDDTIKYKTAKPSINKTTNSVTYTCTVDYGHNYKVRCRAARGTIYGGWTAFTSNEQSLPSAPTEITTLRPQILSEQGSKKYCVFVEWPEAITATSYTVQWTTNIENFEQSGSVSSQTTNEGEGPRLLISDLELGHEYFFRVNSKNNKGDSPNWTPVKSVILGREPSAPTTWSNTSSCVIGENLNLYWTHNSTDGSYESYARLHITLIDSLNPDTAPMEYTKVIQNTKPEEEKHQTSVYTINTSDDEWSLVKAGFVIKWKVQTAGITNVYSEWSTEREVNVYAQPELTLDVQNQNGQSVDEINSFPFHIRVLATPPAQKPISYYIEVISNQGYETVDEVGKQKVVNVGDKIYQRYFDPETNAWQFLVEMSPSNIDLQNGINYTVNCTVAMDSGLTATDSQTFDVAFTDLFYDVFADINIDKETLSANIHPYCYEYEDVDGVLNPVLTANCKLSVYRREYDGTFTEIATNIDNSNDIYVTDPHPSLDYARYRVVAQNSDTGAISYSDVPAVKIGEPSVVIQWGEAWSSFIADDEGNGSVEPAWSGSMIRIPYNIDVSENTSTDMSLINYVGRKRPVSYHGTHLGESATWNVEIPKYDKELLYAIRRLSIWTEDVYVREPSGTGYWACMSVSYNINHDSLTIPVTFTINRVEGGM